MSCVNNRNPRESIDAFPNFLRIMKIRSVFMFSYPPIAIGLSTVLRKVSNSELDRIKQEKLEMKRMNIIITMI